MGRLPEAISNGRPGHQVFCERANSLENSSALPIAYRIRTYDSPKLTIWTFYLTALAQVAEIGNFETGGGIDAPNPAVTYLDIRRNQSGTYADRPTKVGGDGDGLEQCQSGFQCGR